MNTFCSIAGYTEEGDFAPSPVPPPNVHDEILWRVAGRGEPGPGCGDKISYICPHCQHHTTVTKSCMLRTCPSCFKLWNSKMASKTKSRMERAKIKFRTRLHHVVLSFKDSDKNDLHEFRKACYRILRENGVSGGGMVIHPFREDHMGEFSVPGHHCHVFANGRWLDRGGGKDDVIFKRIGDLKSYQQYYYVFEHCGIAENRHAITWFGNMSYRNFPKTNQEKMHEPGHREVICPNCQCEMELLFIVDYIEKDIIEYHSRDYG